MSARNPRSNDVIVGLAALSFAFAIYLLTLSRSIAPEDAGELAAAAATLGVAHPTGYPLFSLLGRVFTMLPLGDVRAIVKLNLMGAVFCAGAVCAFYNLFLQWLRASSAVDASKTAVLRAAAATAALTLAFSRVYWANAVSVEVYALHLLCLGVVLILFTRALQAHTDRDDTAGRAWFLFAYALGLSFSNHMMTVLLAPVLLYLYFAAHGFGTAAWKKIACAVPAFLLGLTPYLYIPVRAALRPAANWGNPSGWGSFREHVSGGQFRFMMFTSVPDAWERVRALLTNLPADMGWPALVLAAVGAWHLARRDRHLAIAVTLIFTVAAAYVASYTFDDPNFRLNAHLAVALTAAVGLATLGGRLAPRAATPVMAAATLVLVAFPLAAHYRDADASRDYAVEDYARNVIGALQPNAVLFSASFDHVISPLMYLQDVEGLRKDVVVLDYDLMILPWYYATMEARAPWLVAGLRAQFARIAENGGDRIMMGGVRPALIRDAVEHLGVPVYGTQELLPAGINAESEGLVVRLFMTQPPAPSPEPPLMFRPLARDNHHTRTIRSLYALGIANLGITRALRGDTLSGERLLARALAIQPHFPEARQWLDHLRQGP